MSRITAPASFLLALAITLSPLTAGAFAAAPTAVQADDVPVTWSVEPVQTASGLRRTFDYTTDPGTQIVDSVLITNQGTAPADFLIYATDATNDLDTGAFGLLKRDEKPTDIGSWITMASDKLTIGPGMQATVPFNLLIPSDAAPGDHVAGIVAAVLTTGQQDGSAVTLEQRVGARVYLTVSGIPKVGVEATGLVAGFTPEWNPFAPGTMDVNYLVHNTGNIRMDINQKVVVTGPFGIPLGEFTPDPIPNLLPRQSVRVHAVVPAIAALALAWSNVTVTPGAIGTAGKAPDAASGATASPAPTAATAAEPTPTSTSGTTTVTDKDTIEYVAFTSSVMSLAISWTLLVVIILVIAAIYFIQRYVRGTRDRMYLAIDEAAAAARAERPDSDGADGK